MKLKIATALVVMLLSGSAFAGPVTISQADQAAIKSGNLAMPTGIPLIDVDGNFYGYVTPDVIEKVQKAVSMGIGQRRAIIQITGLKNNVPQQRRTEYSAEEIEALKKAVEIRDQSGKLWGMTTPEIAKQIDEAVAIGIQRPTAIKRFAKFRQAISGYAAIPVSPEVFAGIETVPVAVAAPAIDQKTTADLSTSPVVPAEDAKPAAVVPATPDMDL